jgi:hypothetical protein
MNDRIRTQIELQWRRLGFFYEIDGTTRTWRLVGSRAGLLRE